MTGESKPLAVLPLEAGPADGPLAYAMPVTNIEPLQVTTARWMVALAVLSGCCVGVCFALLSLGVAGRILYAGVFLATLGVGGRVGFLLQKLGGVSPTQMLLDLTSGVALLGMGLIPPLMWGDRDVPGGRAGLIVFGTSFLAMAVTTYRHRLNYQLLSGWSIAAGRPRGAKGLRALGNIKMVYEALWLLCCAIGALGAGAESQNNQLESVLIVFALSALFGCAGYGVIWIWMIFAHSFLATRLRRAQRPGT